MTLSIATLYIECHCTERHYAECRISFIFMLNVVMLSVIMMSVVMLNVVAPLRASVTKEKKVL